MSRPALRVEGLAELSAKLSLVRTQARKAAEEAVREEVALVGDDAEGGAPVDTGELRAGIVRNPQGLDGEVRSTARHSTFVEHGTFKDTAQPFMAPAAERSRRRFPARAGALIKIAVEGLGR